MRAQRIASRLMVELCGATLVPGTIDVAAEPPPQTRLLLRGARVTGLLGIEIAQADQVAYLERLGFGVETDGEDLAVTVPPDRHYDVTREVDLVEEVGRIHGLDENLPSTLPASAGRVGGLSREQRLRRRAEDTMRDLGFDEVVGWSFTDPGEAGRLRIAADDPRSDGVLIANPLSEDQSVMRTTVIGSLLDAARGNLARGAERVALFESGRVYLSDSPPTGRKADPETVNRPIGPLAGDFAGERAAPFREPHRIACLAVGPLAAKSWRGGESRPTSSRSRACSKASPASSAPRSPSRPSQSRSCIPAARRQLPPSPPVPGPALPPAGSASCTRWSAARGTSSRRPPLKSTSPH